MHSQDETHLETNRYLCRVSHRKGQHPTLPAAGTNRRVTTFGSVELFGGGAREVVCAGQDAAVFLLYLAARDRRRAETGRQMYLAPDNGPCHTSATSRDVLAQRADWLHVIWLARYRPQLNPKEARPISYRGAA